jgi:hypothetical protein
MSNTHFTWDKFVENFGPEMKIAGEIFDSMTGHCLRDGCLFCFDFTFVSNRRENLVRLAQFLQSRYPFSITVSSSTAPNGIWQSARKSRFADTAFSALSRTIRQ